MDIKPFSSLSHIFRAPVTSFYYYHFRQRNTNLKLLNISLSVRLAKSTNILVLSAPNSSKRSNLNNYGHGMNLWNSFYSHSKDTYSQPSFHATFTNSHICIGNSNIVNIFVRTNGFAVLLTFRQFCFKMQLFFFKLLLLRRIFLRKLKMRSKMSPAIRSYFGLWGLSEIILEDFKESSSNPICCKDIFYNKGQKVDILLVLSYFQLLSLRNFWKLLEDNKIGYI